MAFELKKLSDVCRLINGRAYKKHEMLAEGKYPLLRVGNFFTNRSWFYSDLELNEDKYCDRGDLLYAWSASFGPRIWDGDKVIYHYHIWKIELNEDLVDKGYLYHLLEWDTEQIKEEQGTGTTMIHVTKGAMEKRMLPFPSIPEQKRIVALLDTVFSDLEQTRAKTEKNLKNARELFDNYLQKIFTKKGDGWVETTLGELCEKTEYGTSSKSQSDGDIPVLRMGNIQGGVLNWEKLKYTSNKSDIEKLLLKENDVLFNRTNSPELVGKSAIYRNEMPAIFAGYLIRIHRKKELLDANYLNYYLNSNFARTYGFSIMSHSTNQANINGTKLKSYPINIPNISEQSNLGNSFRKLELEVIKIENIYKKKLLKIEELKKSILQKAFSGELTAKAK